MIKYLAFEVVIKLNYFTVKGGLSPYDSPRVIVDQQTLDYNKHCKITFGAFVQKDNDNNMKNSNISRTIDGIYLLSLNKILGVHEIFGLHSHRVITIWKIVEIPITNEINKHIEDITACEKVTSLKLKNIAGVIYDNDWIAGVK